MGASWSHNRAPFYPLRSRAYGALPGFPASIPQAVNGTAARQCRAPAGRVGGRARCTGLPATGFAGPGQPALHRHRQAGAGHAPGSPFDHRPARRGPALNTRPGLGIDIQAQPDLQSCGPTCLQAVYNWFGHQCDLHELIATLPTIEGGGTVAVLLANDALRRGFQADIYTYNLRVFDPSWFTTPGTNIAAKLSLQMQAKNEPRIRSICSAYIEFLAMGGRLKFVDLTRALLRGILGRGLPILTGLSATYLYRVVREFGDDDHDDDIRGEPTGHFVVLDGYNRTERTISVCDPLKANPLGRGQHYDIHIDRVIGAILLGVLTHDANLLVLRPAERELKMP